MDSDEDHLTTTLKDLPPEIITLITTKGYDFQAMTNFARTSKENMQMMKDAFERDNMCTQAMKRDYGAYKALCTDKVTETKEETSNILHPCTKKEDLLGRVCKEAIHWELLSDKIMKEIDLEDKKKTREQLRHPPANSKFFRINIDFFTRREEDDVSILFYGTVDKEGHIDTLTSIYLDGKFQGQNLQFRLTPSDYLQNYDEFLKAFTKIHKDTVGYAY